MGRFRRWQPVDAFHGQPSATQPFYHLEQSAKRQHASHLVIKRRQRAETATASIEIQHCLPIHQHNLRTGRPLKLPPLFAIAPWPGECSPVWIGRVRNRQPDDTRFLGAVPFRTQPFNCSRQRKLGSAQTLNEVASPDSSAVLHRFEDRIDG